ncbi:hypothetical protein MD484_g8571, partial [Candolleomyces efflorescens]
MQNPQLPMAMLYLSALSHCQSDSRNPAMFSAALVPSRETHLEDPQLRRMSKVLDALVFFLPSTKDRVFALSLEVGERVTISVAGNDDEHFLPAFGHTPDAMIQSVWDALRSIASEPENTARVKELVGYLFERHETKMRARFNKRKEQCRLFFELVNDPAFLSQRTPEQREFFKAAEKIFKFTARVFELPPEKRKEAYYGLHCRLEQYRPSYSKGKHASYIWRDLELKIQERRM